MSAITAVRQSRACASVARCTFDKTIAADCTRRRVHADSETLPFSCREIEPAEVRSTASSPGERIVAGGSGYRGGQGARTQDQKAFLHDRLLHRDVDRSQAGWGCYNAPAQELTRIAGNSCSAKADHQRGEFGRVAQHADRQIDARDGLALRVRGMERDSIARA